MLAGQRSLQLPLPSIHFEIGLLWFDASGELSIAESLPDPLWRIFHFWLLTPLPKTTLETIAALPPAFYGESNAEKGGE